MKTIDIDLEQQGIKDRKVRSSTSFLQKISKMPFSQLQYKLIATYLASLSDDADTLPMLGFRTQQLATIAELKNKKNIFQAVRQALKTLKMDIDIADGDSKGDFVEVFYHRSYDETRGIVKIAFDQRLSQYVLNISKEIRSEYLLSDLFKIKENYTISLFYHLCLQAKSVPTDYEVTLDELREITLGDQAQSKYKSFGHFNSRILSPSIERINANTHLKIQEVQTLPIGQRKVTGIRFVLQKEKASTNDVTSASIQDPAVQRLVEVGIHQQTALNLVTSLSADYANEQVVLSFIESCITYTQQREQRKPFTGTNGWSKYLVASIKNNYPNFDPNKELQSQRLKAVKTQQDNAALYDKCLQTKASLLSDYKREHIQAFIATQPDHVLNAWIAEFNSALAEGEFEIYTTSPVTRDTYTNFTVYFQFERFLESRSYLLASEFKPTTVEIEDYAKQHNIDWHSLEQKILSLAKTQGPFAAAI